MSLIERSSDNFLSQWWWTVDRISLALFLLIMLVGILLVATSTGGATPSPARKLFCQPPADDPAGCDCDYDQRFDAVPHLDSAIGDCIFPAGHRPAYPDAV
jgi:hypothetical protein